MQVLVQSDTHKSTLKEVCMYIHVVHVVHVRYTCFFMLKQALLQASAVHVQHDTTSNYVVHYNMRQCLIDMTEKYHRNSCACVCVCI